MKFFRNLSKKAIAFLVAIMLVFSSITVCIAVMANVEETEPIIWGGQEDVATGFAGGSGTKADPYEISNGAEFAYLMTLIGSESGYNRTKTSGKYYELTTDIYLNDVSDPNWKENNPNSWYSFDKRFGGFFNGNGHTVYGIYYNGNGSGYGGLFPIVDAWDHSIVIENVTVSAAYINGSIVGGITGRVYGNTNTTTIPTFLNCTVTSDVTIEGASYAGGISGFIQDNNKTYYQLVNCVSDATVNTNNKYFGVSTSRLVQYNGYDVAAAFAGGKGTVEDPFKIATKEQLFKMILDTKTTGYYYELVADIDLNDTTSSDWKATATNWIRPYLTFNGTFDGNGHTINGLYYNGSATNIAFIKETGANAVVKNVIFTNASINTTSVTGAAIVTGSGGGIFSKIYIDETCEVIAPNAEGVAGITCHGSSKVTIDDSAVLATIVGGKRVGAIVGNHFYSSSTGTPTITINNSFSATPNLKISGYQALKNSSNNYALVADDYGTTALTADQMQGIAAKNYMSSLNWAVWKVDENGGYPTLRFTPFNGDRDTPWTGAIANEYAGGKGTAEQPFLIETAEQLAKLVNDSNTAGKYYKLTADIIINDTTKENWKANARQWYGYNYSAEFKDICSFQGTLDGDGHTISGLYYNGSDYYFGLFVAIKSGTVFKNLIISDSYIKSANAGGRIGALVSYTFGDATFENCIITDTVTVVGDHAAGFVSNGSGALNFKNCGVFATLSGITHTGAFLADVWGGTKTVNSCIATTTFSTMRGFSGSNNYSLVAATNIEALESAEQMKGAAARDNMPLLSWGVWKADENGGYPTLRFTPFNGDRDTPWTGAIAYEYAGGEGTAENPFLIETAEQLAKLVKDSNTAGKHYKLIANIIINDTTKENWKEKARQWYGYDKGAEFADIHFQGTFDGNNKTISGLYYNGSGYYFGLFAAVKGNAVIKNVIIKDSHLESSNEGGSISAFAGYIAGAVKYQKCVLQDSVTIKGGLASGFASHGSGQSGIVEIDTCGSYASVSGKVYSAAFIADVWSATLRINNSIGLVEFSPRRSFVGGNNYGLVADKYGTNVLTLKQMKGEAAKKNMPLLNWDRSWKVTDSFPIFQMGEYEGKPGQAWSGKLATKYAGGTGTKEDPYLISTPEQLAKLVANVTETNGEYYKLTHDIYLNDIKKNWENNAKQWFWASGAKAGGFYGHFDGDGHVIYGLYLNVKQTSEYFYAGLFPTIYDNSSVEKLGISEAKITIEYDTTTRENFVGGITSMVVLHKTAAETDPSELPVISQCFIDKKSTITAKYAGGLVGGGLYVPHMYNCYSVANLIGERIAAVVGNTWTTYEGTIIENCYSATDDALHLLGGRASITNSVNTINFKNNYSNGDGLAAFMTKLSLLMMRGDAAKNYMTTLDFDKIWYALPNGTPVLRIFGTTDKFSNTTTPDPIEVSFVSNGGTACESIFGNPEDPIVLPTPTREGCEFAGWYVYKELDVPYNVDVFPYFNTVLYAKWIEKGIIEGFESYTNSVYDYEDDYEYYKPGTAGYSAKYVRNGMASIHRIGLKSSEQDFLLNYEKRLEIGRNYKLSFWVCTDKENTKGTLSLVHEKFPDVFDDDLGVQEIKVLKGMKVGEWQQVEVNFTAKTKWIAIRTTGDASLYFDDVMIVPTGEKVENVDTGGFNIVPVIIIAAVVILLIAGTVVAIIIIKKKKAK